MRVSIYIYIYIYTYVSVCVYIRTPCIAEVATGRSDGRQTAPSAGPRMEDEIKGIVSNGLGRNPTDNCHIQSSGGREWEGFKLVMERFN